MSLHWESAFIVSVLLVSIRFSVLFLLSPLFAVAQVPLQIRTLLLLGFSFVLVLSIGANPNFASLTAGALIEAAVNELLLAGMLAFGMFAAFGAFMFGGRILDFQVGFGVASLIDPATNTQSPLLGTLLNVTAVMTFFLINGHHMLIRGMAYSLEKIPPGSGMTNPGMDAMVSQFGLMFVFGVALVAPALVILLLIDVGMALAARTMPQVNVFIVGLPIKIFVGLSMLAISMEYLAPLFSKIFESVFIYWQNIIG